MRESAREREREVTLSRGAQQGDSRVSGRAPSVSPQVYASRTATGRAGSARRMHGGRVGEVRERKNEYAGESESGRKGVSRVDPSRD